MISTPIGMPKKEREAFVLGHEEGVRVTRVEVLSWFQKEYVEGDFDRDSPEAKATLDIVRKFSSEFRP